jgi:hypothetical protein
MRARFAGLTIPLALAFFALATLADGAAAFPGNFGENLGKKISRTVNDAVAEAKAEAERAQREAADADAVEPAPDEAVLSLEGTEGTGFSGTCAANGQEREISGQVPARYTFVGLDEDGIECEIRKTDPDGKLKVIFAAGGARSVQSMTGTGSTIKIAHEDGNFSYSTVSGGGSSSSVVSSSSQTVR